MGRMPQRTNYLKAFSGSFDQGAQLATTND